jgi:beta-lactam-binding protein with PASTA domain
VASTAHLTRLVADECRLVKVPEVRGRPLDEAQTQLKADDLRFKTVGGGLFGIVVTHNWTVCDTKPASGTRVFRQSEVELTVARSC